MTKKIKKYGIIIGIIVLVCVAAYMFYTEYWLHKDDTDETIHVEIEQEAKDFSKLSKPELLALNASEIKKSLEAYMPNFKANYGYSDIQTLKDEDYLNIRNMICMEMYGSLSGGQVTSTIVNGEPDAIYYAPNVEDIKNLSNNDFAVYLNNAYAYFYGEDYMKEKGIDFTTLSQKDLVEEKQDFIKLLEKNNGNIKNKMKEEAKND